MINETWFIPGYHSIPTIHTTHKHIEAFQPQRDTLKASWLYASGQQPSDYPMPAIRYELDYHRDLDDNVVAVSLWYESNPGRPVCLEYWP